MISKRCWPCNGFSAVTRKPLPTTRRDERRLHGWSSAAVPLPISRTPISTGISAVCGGRAVLHAAGGSSRRDRSSLGEFFRNSSRRRKISRCVGGPGRRSFFSSSSIEIRQ
ncbi:hypothetical protein HN011_005855 [Eciton burchellii]|nr:hypothetical protein HN011_005855 [Eciton burchellii]